MSETSAADTTAGAPAGDGAAAGATTTTATTTTTAAPIDTTRAKTLAERARADRAAADAAAAAKIDAGKTEAQKLREELDAVTAKVAAAEARATTAERMAALERAGVLPEYRDTVPVLEGKALDDWLAAHPAILRSRVAADPPKFGAPKTHVGAAMERGSKLITPEYLAAAQRNRPTS